MCWLGDRTGWKSGCFVRRWKDNWIVLVSQIRYGGTYLSWIRAYLAQSNPSQDQKAFSEPRPLAIVLRRYGNVDGAALTGKQKFLSSRQRRLAQLVWNKPPPIMECFSVPHKQCRKHLRFLRRLESLPRKKWYWILPGMWDDKRTFFEAFTIWVGKSWRNRYFESAQNNGTVVSGLFSIGKSTAYSITNGSLYTKKRKNKTPGDSENLLCHIREKLECGETPRRFNVCSEHGVSQDQERCLQKREAERREFLIMSKSKNRWFVRSFWYSKPCLKGQMDFSRYKAQQNRGTGQHPWCRKILNSDFLWRKG